MIAKLTRNTKQFFEIDLWRIKVSTLPKFKGFVFKTLRVLIISFSEFNRDKITEKASALTYFTLLSIIPVLAIAFGIAKGFGLEEYLESQLAQFFAGQETILQSTQQFTSKMLDNAHGGVIIGVSFLFILYAVLRLMYNIEMAFNEIWDTSSRPWQRKIADYLAIILLGPIFLIMSGGATVMITSGVRILASMEILGFIRPLILFGINLIPYLVIYTLLTILFVIFPNTRVKAGPAILSAVITGTLYQVTQLAWLQGQVYLFSNYRAVYGTLAALPLFMIYLQISWMLVLFGAELAYAIQNVNTFQFKQGGIVISQRHRRQLTILIMYHLIKNFEIRGSEALSVSGLSSMIQVPYRYIKQICNELEKAKLINKIADEEIERYQPALDINQIDIHMLLKKLEMSGYDQLKSDDDEKFDKIEDLLEEISEASKKSKGNKLIKDL